MKNQYIYPNLVCEMKKRGITHKKLGKVLNLVQSAATYRLTHSRGMPIDDAFIIQQELFPDCELQYLFERGD